MARWRLDPSLHVYHYAPYETSAAKKLMGKYATREAEVDELLTHGVFVDLYAVVKQGFIIGTRSYSLKEIERLYMPQRQGEVLSAGASVVEYQRWKDSGEPSQWEQSPVLKGIRDYNQLDCESLVGLRSWLLDRRQETGVAYIPNPTKNGSAPSAGAGGADGGGTARQPVAGALPSRVPRAIRRGRTWTSSSAGWWSSTGARKSRCGGGCSSATT